MKMISRRNNVTLENGRIVKRFSDVLSMKRELDLVILLKNAGVIVPDVLKTEDKVIEYTFLKGDIYQNLVDDFNKKHANALLRWLESFYAVTKTLRGDVNLRNFIYCPENDICAGIDFEEERGKGERESDYGRIIAYAVTYDPAFTIKKLNCAKLLYDCFTNSGADGQKMRGAYEEEIQDIINRRTDKHYDMDNALRFWGKFLC
jgi:hypothetical protein